MFKFVKPTFIALLRFSEHYLVYLRSPTVENVYV